MKLYFLILWLSGSEPEVRTFTTRTACEAAYVALSANRMLASRCMMQESA